MVLGIRQLSCLQKTPELRGSLPEQHQHQGSKSEEVLLSVSHFPAPSIADFKSGYLAIGFQNYGKVYIWPS